MENNTDAHELPEGEDVHPRERLLALMDRVDALGEAQIALGERNGHPEVKARYLAALEGLEEEARVTFEEYRREVVPQGRA